MKPTGYRVPPLAKVFVEAGKEFSRDNAMRLSAALSYYSIFSIAPLLLIAVGIAGWVYKTKQAQGDIVQLLTQFIGWNAAQAVQSIMESASKASSGATIVGFVTLILGASTVFAQLKESLNVIWKVKQKDGLGIWMMIRERLFSFGLVLAVGFLLLISLILTTTVAALMSWLHHSVGVPGFLSGVFGYVVPLCLEVLLFAMLFKVVPDAYIDWKDVWVGAGVTALLFEGGKIGLSFYLGKGGATSSFGAAGSVVLLLLWVYYASCILFYGAEFTEVYARAHGHALRPAPIAEPTEIWTEHGPVPAASLDAAVIALAAKKVRGESIPSAPGGTPLPFPQKESLAPLLAAAERTRVEEEPSTPHVPHTWREIADEHPAAEFGAALGVGLAVGILIRLRG